MMCSSSRNIFIGLCVLSLTACGDRAKFPLTAGMGPAPVLPAPNPTLIPTVAIAPATGWPANGQPTAAAGLEVSVFAENLNHPRWLYVLPNSDVLVAETNAPERPKEGRGRCRDSRSSSSS